MRAASATLSTTNMTSSPIILTTRPRALVTMSWEISSKRRTTAASSSSLRCWLRRVKPDHVGEPDRQHRALPGGQAVAAQHHVALDPRRHLAPPDELEQLGHGRDGDVGHAGEGVGRQHRVDLGVDHVAGHQLGLGDPGHRGADDPGHLQRRLDVGRTQRLQALEEADRFEVEVGEGGLVVVDAGEAEGTPEALELVEADTGQLGDLDPGVAAAGGDEHAVGHEEVDHAVGDGLVDLLLGGPVHEEDLLDVGQGGLHGVPRRRPRAAGRSCGRGRSRRQPPQQRLVPLGAGGPAMSVISASGGEQRPSTMAWTCSAIGISTPLARARPTRGPALFTPSATMCMPPTISSSERP